MWTKARILTYLTSAFAGIGFLLMAMGFAEFDQATGMIDLKPFNAYALAAIIAPPLASLLAMVAAALGWGKK